jgi:hypothetical protein
MTNSAAQAILDQLKDEPLFDRIEKLEAAVLNLQCAIGTEKHLEKHADQLQEQFKEEHIGDSPVLEEIRQSLRDITNYFKPRSCSAYKKLPKKRRSSHIEYFIKHFAKLDIHLLDEVSERPTARELVDAGIFLDRFTAYTQLSRNIELLDVRDCYSIYKSGKTTLCCDREKLRQWIISIKKEYQSSSSGS